MGNEVSRPAGDESPQAAGPAPATPTGGPRRTQSFPTRAPSPLPGASRPPPSPANPRVDRTIQRMDKTIRRRVRGGVTYNMKLLIRGERGTGKTSLFHRLQGEPIPETHAPTPQLQTATINWSFRTNLEESVKCEVWDVVDRGFIPSEEGDPTAEPSDLPAGNAVGATPATSATGALQNGDALATAAVAAATGATGMHVVATVDASTVDVYQEAHGVIFLLDVTKWETLEYVRQQLELVPVHIPTLVLGNFRDCGSQRKVFKEDIQDLLYGSGDRSHRQLPLRRPHELLYFECSLLNCYGLKALHQYFGIPFLQLKLTTIRQQLRIVEGEFSHLKNDLQANIREQRYVDYLDHIKATGSDIRTGRRTSNASSPTTNGSREPDQSLSDDKLRRTSSAVSDTSDIVVDRGHQPGEQSSDAASAVNEEVHQDLGDLPGRDSSSVVQVTIPLKIEHVEPTVSVAKEKRTQETETSTSRTTNTTVPSTSSPTPANGGGKEQKTAVASPAAGTGSSTGKSKQPTRKRQGSVDEPMGLEDFQAPAQRNSDLDHFYSSDESDADDISDQDVVVSVADTTSKIIGAGRSHKQVFIDSDSSDSDRAHSSHSSRRARGKERHRSPSKRRPGGKSSTTEVPAARSPPSPVSLPKTTEQSSDSASAQQVPQSKSPVHSHAAEPSDQDASESAERIDANSSGSTPESEGVNGTADAEAAEAVNQASPDSSPIDSVPSSPRQPPAASASTSDDAESAQATESGADTAPVAENIVYSGENEGEDVAADQANVVHDDAKSEEESPAQVEAKREDEEDTRDSPQVRVVDEISLEDHKATPEVEVATDDADESVVDDVSIAKHSDAPAADDADMFNPELVASSAEMDAFLSDDDDDEDEDPDDVPRSSKTHVEEDDAQAKPKHEDSSPRATLSNDVDTPSRPSAPGRHAQERPVVIESDADSSDDGEVEVVAPPSPKRVTPSPPPMNDPVADFLVPSDSLPKTAKRDVNDLESFLNESESDSDADPARWTTSSTQRQVAVASDGEDEGEVEVGDRFASYSVNRKSRAQRRQQREEVKQFGAALDATQHDFDAASTASSASAGTSGIENSDVLAAIRKAQEDALQMLSTVEESAPAARKKSSKSSKERSRRKSSHDDVPKEHKPRRAGKKKASSSSSSSRSRHRRDHVEDSP